MIYREIQERARLLTWPSFAACLLASAERLAIYRAAYLRLKSATNELNIRDEPDLEKILDRGWSAVAGYNVLAPMAFGFDGDLASLWGALAGGQIKGHVFDVADAVVGRASTGHLQMLLRSGFDLFASLQEFSDDGYLIGPAGWLGPVEEELKAMTADLEWLQANEGAEKTLELRSRWRCNGMDVVLLEK